MSICTVGHTNVGSELKPGHLPVRSRSRQLRRTISALIIAVALPAAFGTSQAAAQGCTTTTTITTSGNTTTITTTTVCVDDGPRPVVEIVEPPVS